MYLIIFSSNLINNDISEDIINCNDSIELITKLFPNIDEIEKIVKYFPNIKNGNFTLNTQYKIYGIPDLLADDYVIDIKISNDKITTKDNILQLLFYSILTNKHNICLYEPLSGYIYTMFIDNNKYNLIKDYFNMNSIEIINSYHI